MDIQNLYFGKDDAETDFTNSGLLQGSFLKTAIYNQIKSRSKSLIVGRKGSGKSALCLMLKKELSEEQKTYVCVVTPDAISADEIRRFHMDGVNEQQSKKLIWKYIFLVHICKFILQASREKYNSESDWLSTSTSDDWLNVPEFSTYLKKIRTFLIENREVDDLNFQENFWRIINKLKTKLTLKALEQSVEIETSQTPNEGLDLNSKLEFLEDFLKKPLEHFRDYKFFMLVDKVDEIWDNDSSSDEMVIGLLMASKQLNQISNNVSSTVFLRTDIYDQLQFFDKDKYHGDEVPVIWTHEMLSEVILERAKVSTRDQGISSEIFYSKYFPDEVDNVKTCDFIFSHTLMRPRDIIQLCNLCVDIARREGLLPVNSKHVKQAIDVYSNWKLNDLISEYKVNYPFLNDLLILFSNTSYVVLRERFQTIVDRVLSTLEERYPDYRTFFSIDSVLNILYSIGFLGVERLGRPVFYYKDDRMVEDNDKFFIVHPAFRNALKCTSSINIQPFSPTDENISSRYIFEIQRGRGASRNIPEKVTKIRNADLDKLISGLESLRRKVIQQQQLPAEVTSEISRNISIMILEIQENSYLDGIQSEIVRMNIIRYLRKLKETLHEIGFLSEESSLGWKLEELFRNS